MLWNWLFDIVLIIGLTLSTAHKPAVKSLSYFENKLELLTYGTSY